MRLGFQRLWLIQFLLYCFCLLLEITSYDYLYNNFYCIADPFFRSKQYFPQLIFIPQELLYIQNDELLIYKSVIRSELTKPIPLAVMDSKSHDKKGRSRGGFIRGSNLFTVTNNLKITHVSPIWGLSILNELKDLSVTLRS